MINSIEFHTPEISRLLDHHLHPVVKQILSYMKDTNHFINKVNNFCAPVKSILVIMDVRSLYTSIPNNEDIAATNKKYDIHIHKTLPTKIITTFLALLLTLNNFVFNSKFYLQTKDCAIGTIVLQGMILNINTFTCCQKINQFFSCTILMISLWHVSNLKNS